MSDAQSILSMSHTSEKLEDDEVRVEIHFLDVSEDRARELTAHLNEQERERCRKISNPLEGFRAAVCRGLLRERLGILIGMAPGEIRFSYNSYGKPALLLEPGTDRTPHHFNISHSDGIAAFAFSTHRELGVDVERVRPETELDCDRAAETAFAESEKEEYFSFPHDERHELFFRTWARKEAFAKGLGLGLQLNRYSMAGVSVDSSRPARAVLPAFERRRWILEDLNVGRRHKGAIAIGRGRKWDGEPKIRVLTASCFA